MAQVRVVFYRGERGDIPVLKWFDLLPEKAQDRCFVRIERLQEKGHELRRPEADFLRDGVYELRTKHLGMNYRILYFFHGRKDAVLCTAFTKAEAKVPEAEINRAIECKRRFEESPLKHTYEED